ncbi:MAG: endonuclease domain-containing protein [Candidatus Doudnabacteria bacterium]|nr:endonuclease domain-containing protein [Candidatus Doudnabacteria bacterium]
MRHNTRLVRMLRNNLTDAEKYLWYALRLKNLGVKFRRQALIGKYVVDFVCFERKLVIEVDGGQHANNKLDLIRDKWLQSQGFIVLRFWNNEVLENREGVLDKILCVLTPSLALPTRGRE